MSDVERPTQHPLSVFCKRHDAHEARYLQGRPLLDDRCALCRVEQLEAENRIYRLSTQSPAEFADELARLVRFEAEVRGTFGPICPTHMSEARRCPTTCDYRRGCSSVDPAAL